MDEMLEQLLEKCKKISVSHLNSLVHTPPFLPLFEAFDGELNDENVCKVVCNAVIKISVFDPKFKKAYRIARCIYNDVYHEIPLYLYPKAQVPSGYEDQAYLADVLEALSYDSKRVLLAHTGFLDAARRYGTIKDIQTAYLVFESVFFKMIWRRFRTSKYEDQRNQYLVFRNIADEFCELVFEDKSVWRERLAAKLK